jgi:hypothetical protein
MRSASLYLAVLLGGVAMSPAFAADPTEQVQQRNVNQQQRIENGLESGQLNTREAAGLEKQQAHIEHLEAKGLKDGTLSPAEQARINAAENRASRDIHEQKHDGQLGNPDSASSRRMQADVQRNVNQQERINQGIENGSLNNHEVARVERDQAHVNRQEARAGRDGHVGAGETRRIQAHENAQSRRIYRNKHNAR